MSAFFLFADGTSARNSIKEASISLLLNRNLARVSVIHGDRGELALLQIHAHIAEHIQLTDPPTIRAVTSNKLCLQVASIEAALDAIRGPGGRTEADAQPWSFRGLRIQDAIEPEGNVIQLCQPGPAQP